jgi:threonine dehydrogenase-like Zn-dependent dehydrogenase
VDALVFQNSLPRQALTKLLGAVSPRAFVGPLAPMTLSDIPEPTLPAPDWVRLRVRQCGICGSDYKQVFLNGRRDNPMTALVSFPHVLGHEVVGIVDSVGPDATGVRPGQRVVLNPWLSCAPRGIAPPCPACRAGRFSLCENFLRGVLPAGIHTGNCAGASGGFAPLLPAHASQCIPVPEGVSDDAAVLADPFSVSLHAILGSPPAGDSALVYGCGTLGLLSIAILRELHPDVQVIAVARYAHQALLAAQLGASLVVPWRPVEGIVDAVARATGCQRLQPWHGRPWLLGGVGTTYDTVGSPETVEIGIRVTAPRGALVVTGVEMPARFEWTPLYFKELRIVGSNAFGRETLGGETKHAMELYFDLVRDRALDVTPIITHRFRLEQYREAFLACYDQGASSAVKVVFTYPDVEALAPAREPLQTQG